MKPYRTRRGQALIIVAFSLTLLFGFFALVLDVGLAFYLHQRLQCAADMACLAAATNLPNTTNVDRDARALASMNGFTQGQENTQITVTPNTNAFTVSVRIVKPYITLMAHLLGVRQFNVGATATAQYVALAPMSIDGNDQLNNIQSLGLFGPFAIRGNGDPFSVRYLANGQLNPQYLSGGWNFNMTVPNDYSGPVKVGIFDPDCGNVDGNVDAGAGRLDEMRDTPAYPAGTPGAIAKGGSYNRATTTVYKIYAPDDTPNDLTDDVLIASYSARDPDFSGSDKTDMTWVHPGGFTFNTDTHGKGTYRINVETTSGSSENGFLLRAGPPSMSFTSPAAGQALTIEAPGYLPLNLNTGGVIHPTLGTLPPNPTAPLVVHINKFDTEGDNGVSYNVPGVGNRTGITYTVPGISGTVSGVRAGGDAFAEDTITVPVGGTGGPIVAHYHGNGQDTSMWSMWFTGAQGVGNSRARLTE